MRVLRAGFDPDHFFAALQRAHRRVLFLDYDGTLAPFRVQRDQAVPYAGVREVLATLQSAAHTRIVIVTGRSCAGVLPLLGLDEPPEVWGSHGGERLFPDGRCQTFPVEPAAADALQRAYAWVVEKGMADRCERKSGCLAFHLRGLPPERQGRWTEQVRAAWGDIARSAGLVVQPFDGGVELRVPGRDKGRVVATVLAEEGEGAVAAYLGDDLTDEDGFRALAGRGMAVLVRPAWRPTAADVWIRPPQELLAFLWRWHRLASGGAQGKRAIKG